MPCSTINGYEIDCRDSVAGIKEIYLAEYNNIASYTESSGVCTAISMVGATKFFTYQMEKENAEFMDNGTGSVENGTLFYAQELKFTMKKLSAAKRNTVKLLAQNRLVAIVLDQNGLYWILGRHNGLDLLTYSAKSGKAMGDLNGYELTLTGKETNPVYSFTGSLVNILD
jgi:exosome complex RNA-binding protein Rrp4